MKPTTKRALTYGSVLTLAVGVALLATFGALAYESGIRADETGSVGALTPVELGTGLAGLALLAVSITMWIISALAPSR